MAAHELGEYQGRLSAAQIAAGMNAAEDNAARLLADAQLLLNAERYPTAASVAIFCIEEAAKVSVLRRIATSKDEAERREGWHEYRSRRNKNRHSIAASPVAPTARDTETPQRGVDGWAEEPGTLDMVKKLGLYTECLGDASWSAPRLVVQRQLAELIVGIALITVDCGYIHTAKEVELWTAHIAPFMNKPVRWIRTGLRNWRDAMAELGLTDAESNAVDQLVERALRSGL